MAQEKMDPEADRDREADTIRLDLPAAHKYLNVIAPCCAELLARAADAGDRDALIYGVQLAAQEICTNIVEHAYADRQDGRIAVALTLDEPGRRLIAEFRDTGRSFDPAVVRQPDLEVGQVRGYGLFLIRQLVDDVRYTPLPAGNCWRIEKRW